MKEKSVPGDSEQQSELFFFFFKGIKLREANQQQQFNRNVEDIELWLYEVEGHLASDDYGKDLTSVQNLQKKHALLEADVAAHQVTSTQPKLWSSHTLLC